jgi:hypothetical protein
MKRILLLVTVALVMAAIMLVMAMPALAFHNPPTGGECGKGKCTGIGPDENRGRYQNNENGDIRNEACEVNGRCWGTENN